MLFTSADQSLPQTIYTALRNDILSLKLKPGSSLNEREMATKLCVSRTPLREALFTLWAEGLVKRYSKLGFVVSELTLKDVVEAFQIREIIEPPAAAIAAKVLPEESLRELEIMLQSLKTESIDEEKRNSQHDILDTQMHDLIIKAVGNARLTDIMDTIKGVCARARCLGTPLRFLESTDESLNIIRALLRRDPEEAQQCMKIHLENTLQRLVLYI